MTDLIRATFDEAKERAEMRGDEYRYGRIAKDLAAVPLAVRKRYLPDGIVQTNDVMDTYGCASRSPVLIAKAKLTYLYHNGMHPELRKWLRSAHMIGGKAYSYVSGEKENAKVIVDETFIEILSGTTPSGNSLKAPLQAIHDYGLIPECLPLEAGMTWEEYMDRGRITEEMLELGREFNKRLRFYFEQVARGGFEEARNDDFLDVALYAWHSPRQDGTYWSDSDDRPNHAVPEINNDILLQDSYEPHLKTLEKNYQHFEWGYSLSIPFQNPLLKEAAPDATAKKKAWLMAIIEAGAAAVKWLLLFFKRV